MEEQRRREEFLKTQEGFRRNAFKIITKMVDWCNRTQGSKHLVDEILHSIFFLGKINKVPYSPESIIDDEEMITNLQEKYPQPFECYLTQLPRRSPFSCVMDMVVKQEKQENENHIKESLTNLINSLEENFLVSSTICVSQKSNNSVRYYGVSMSTTGPNAGNIVIAASCFSAWDNYVADAVMTYYPEKGQKGKEHKKKSYFDGTIKLPESVVCKAYSLSNGDEIPPCKSCGNLFGFPTDQKKEWPYGHCAEAESLSNLLKNEQEVKRETKQGSDTCKPENRKKARESVLDKLRAVLSTIQFNKWSQQNGQFYNPQS
ncbi:uncharacterized protein [Trachinotus anak]|uniref:uncharacterized protein n=1 Tax=Trachinotus anak TaxID=443729 RepID=UPI0039F195E7